MVGKRKGSTERGYNYRWQKARKAYLLRPENALCVTCKDRGRVTVATQLDHIQPHRGDYELFWDESNWQPLCQQCHGRKSAHEANDETPPPVKREPDTTGHPMDPAHPWYREGEGG